MTSRKLRRLRGYREVWAIDSEYNWRPSKAHIFPAEPQPDASIQHPVALVGWELYSGRKVRLFEGEFGPEPPFDIGEDVLFIGYNLAAEWQTFLALGWPLPCRALDLFVEYRRHICAVPGVDVNVAGNKRLPKALSHFGIRPKHTAEEKDEEIALVSRGGPWTPAERERVLDYCGTDVEPLEELAQCLLDEGCPVKGCNGEPLRTDPRGVAQAVHRGRYSFAAARMIHRGIPLDVELLNSVLDNWEEIRLAIIAEQDTFGVYVDGHFSEDRFLALTDELGIDWPKTKVAQRPVLEAKKIEYLVGVLPGAAAAVRTATDPRRAEVGQTRHRCRRPQPSAAVPVRHQDGPQQTLGQSLHLRVTEVGSPLDQAGRRHGGRSARLQKSGIPHRWGAVGG